MFSIKYNRTTNHIAGIGCKTQGPASDRSNDTGAVAYYAENACGSLTRSRLAQGPSFNNLRDALSAARKLSGRKLCKTCEKAAVDYLKPLLPAGVSETDGKLYGPVKELAQMVTNKTAKLTAAGDCVRV